jgi:hypothetical protein
MSAKEYLLKKGFKHVHQPRKRYNLTIEELVIMLEEFSMLRQDFKITEGMDVRQLELWR